ncbi:MAG: hypothetical protein Q4P20_06980 [Eubacteriales bacterium]|nr:hypothetical protein [Eubacteriales bacterium]
MTDKQLKQALKSAYQPPKAEGKQAFLDRIEDSQMTLLGFVCSQLGYISPWGWILSAGIFLAALVLVWQADRQAVWMVSALLPFAALSTITEMNRSVRYGMDELERASRFSLKAVTLARLSILGLENLLLMVLIAPVLSSWGQLTAVQTGFYILCPYSLTAFCDLYIIRRWHVRENMYACVGVAALVSVLCIVMDMLPELTTVLFRLPTCICLTLFLVAIMLREGAGYISHMEELTWN